MTAAEQFTSAAARAGIDFYSGVPCSFLSPLMNAVINDSHATYLGAASEGEAIAIAAGAWLAGRPAAVMFQNSGLGNAINPITSLNHTFRIPVLLVVSWRAEPGVKDEPQHEVMGQITPALLDIIRVRHAPFPDSAGTAAAVDAAARHMGETGLPYAFVLNKNALSAAPLVQARPSTRHFAPVQGEFSGAPRPRRIDAIKLITEKTGKHAAVIATTGYCGRELFTLGDAERNFYVVGSMGGASAIGLGASLNCGREIVVLDGDGAALMKLGNLATIGAAAPANLTHIVLDNEMYESTGGQFTVSPGVDFAAIGAAAGYRQAWRVNCLEDLSAVLDAALSSEGPRFLHVKVAPSGLTALGRPDMPPHEVAVRFRRFLTTPAGQT